MARYTTLMFPCFHCCMYKFCCHEQYHDLKAHIQRERACWNNLGCCCCSWLILLLHVIQAKQAAHMPHVQFSHQAAGQLPVPTAALPIAPAGATAGQPAAASPPAASTSPYTTQLSRCCCTTTCSPASFRPPQWLCIFQAGWLVKCHLCAFGRTRRRRSAACDRALA